MRKNRAATDGLLKEEADPLILACRCGRMGDVKRILSLGIDPNISTSDGVEIPLTAAASEGRLEVVNLSVN